MRKFGSKGQVRFEDDNEFYFTLGFLAGSGDTEIHWEHNEEQGAWASEGRIPCNGDTDNYPKPLKRAFTAGNMGTKFRVNCNEYIEYIRDKHNFNLGNNQNIDSIKKTVPEKYRDEFNRGIKLAK